MHPVFRRKIIEGKQFIAILDQVFNRLGIFGPIRLLKIRHRLFSLRSGRRHPKLVDLMLGLPRRLFGRQLSTLAVLWNQQRCSFLAGIISCATPLKSPNSLSLSVSFLFFLNSVFFCVFSEHSLNPVQSLGMADTQGHLTPF